MHHSVAVHDCVVPIKFRDGVIQGPLPSKTCCLEYSIERAILRRFTGIGHQGIVFSEKKFYWIWTTVQNVIAMRGDVSQGDIHQTLCSFTENKACDTLSPLLCELLQFVSFLHARNKNNEEAYVCGAIAQKKMQQLVASWASEKDTAVVRIVG